MSGWYRQESGQVGLTGQPGQLRQDRTERMGCQDMITMTRLCGRMSCEQEQDSWNRNQAGQDRWTGQVRQDR